MNRQNMIIYGKSALRKLLRPKLFVSGTQLSRDIDEINRGAAELATITFPCTVRRLKRQVFCETPALRSAVPNERLTGIGEYAFCGTRIRKFALPHEISMLKEYTFQNCSDLKHVELGKTLTTIKDGCFQNSGLLSICVPNSVTDIGANAFCCCANLENVHFQSGSKLTQIRNACFQGTKLREITLPATVKQIAKCAFKDCALLQRVSFQKDSCLEKIGSLCFENSGLHDISLPARVKDVAHDAFLNCDMLRNMIMEEGAQVCLAGVKVPSSAAVIPAAEIAIGD